MKLLSLHHSAARRRALQARSPMSDSDDGESTPQEQRQSIMGLAAADSADVATVRSSFRGGDRISSRPSIPSTAPVLDDELEDEEAGARSCGRSSRVASLSLTSFCAPFWESPG
eukprot:s1493_g2.t1